MKNISKPWFKPKQKNDKAITLKMTSSQYESLSFAAMKLKMNKSDLIRNAINYYLAKQL